MHQSVAQIPEQKTPTNLLLTLTLMFTIVNLLTTASSVISGACSAMGQLTSNARCALITITNGWALMFARATVLQVNIKRTSPLHCHITRHSVPIAIIIA